MVILSHETAKISSPRRIIYFLKGETREDMRSCEAGKKKENFGILNENNKNCCAIDYR